MKTHISIVFKGESLSALYRDKERYALRNFTFDGPVTLPEVGEYVSNPAKGQEGEPLSGLVSSRGFSYRENEMSVILTLTSDR